jgi:hypothetical protein
MGQAAGTAAALGMQGSLTVEQLQRHLQEKGAVLA